MDVEIPIVSRQKQTKGQVKALRRTGQLPAVLYSAANPAEAISLSTDDFKTVLRTCRSGFLPTTIFKLVEANGKTKRAVVKDIQYHPTTYDVLHLDFQELHDDKPITLKVPVECINQVDCAGIKLGGFLRPIMRHLRVTCLPKNIPSHFAVDIKDVGLNGFRKVKDIQIPTGVTYLGKPEDVVLSIVKK